MEAHARRLRLGCGQDEPRAARPRPSPNIDIGGGHLRSSPLADRGHVVWTAALHAGGRLIATEDGRVAPHRTDRPPLSRGAPGSTSPAAMPVTAAEMAAVAREISGILVRAIT